MSKDKNKEKPMIKELTEKQTKQLSECRDKWLKIGLSTDRIDRKSFTEDIKSFYTNILKRPEPIVIYMDNPVNAFQAVSLFLKVQSQVHSRVRSRVASQVDSRVDSQVRSQVASQVASQVHSQVHSRVRSQVDSQVDSQVHSRVRSQVASQVRFVYPYLYGSFDAGWFSWIDYYHTYLKILNVPLAESLLRTSQANYIWCLQNVAVISEKPTRISMKDKILHCDGSAAIEYAGINEVKIYALNGVVVPEWLAVKRHCDINPKEFTKIKNVEVRREFVRKVGMERILEANDAELLGSDNEMYELYEFNLGGETGKTKYLKMRNPSIGCYHVECVGKEPETIQQAINFRAGRFNKKLKELNIEIPDNWNPSQLT